MKKFCLVSALLCFGLARGAPSSDDQMNPGSPSLDTSVNKTSSNSSYSTEDPSDPTAGLSEESSNEPLVPLNSEDSSQSNSQDGSAANSAVTQKKPPQKKIQPPSQEVVDKLVRDSDIFDGTSRISGAAIPKTPGSNDVQSIDLSNGVSCKDILLTNVPVPQDADVNLVMQWTYSLCMMELVIQQYIAYQKNTPRADPVLLEQSQSALKKIQQMLPLFLLGYLAAVDSFVRQNLRESINIKRQELTNQ